MFSTFVYAWKCLWWIVKQKQQQKLCVCVCIYKMRLAHSSILAWSIPRTEEPGGLQSMGLKRIKHDWSNWARVTQPECWDISENNNKNPWREHHLTDFLKSPQKLYCIYAYIHVCKKPAQNAYPTFNSSVCAGRWDGEWEIPRSRETLWVLYSSVWFNT